MQVQLETVVRPPIPLNSQRAFRHLQLHGLGEEGLRRTNASLNKQGYFGGAEQLDFEAPVGALVWEAAFESALLKKGSTD